MNPKNEADIIPVQPDDTEMVAAMQTARDRFPEFWSEISTDYKRVIPALGGSMVKAYFHDPEDSEGGEHMRASEVEYDGATITGVLTDRPGHVHSVRSGDRVSFPLEHLSDWLYVDEDKAIDIGSVRACDQMRRPRRSIWKKVSNASVFRMGQDSSSRWDKTRG